MSSNEAWVVPHADRTLPRPAALRCLAARRFCAAAVTRADLAPPRSSADWLVAELSQESGSK